MSVLVPTHWFVTRTQRMEGVGSPEAVHWSANSASCLTFLPDFMSAAFGLTTTTAVGGYLSLRLAAMLVTLPL